MNLVEFIELNIPTACDPLISAVALGILWIVIHDFYHIVFSAMFSFFKKN